MISSPRCSPFAFRILLLSALVLLAVPLASAGDWPTFRGPQRNAISTDTGLLQEWPSEGPKLQWSAEGAGRGYSSLAVVEDRIYTMGDNLPSADDKDEYLLCFERQGGKLLWKTKTGAPWNSGQESWQSSRSTPTVDGDRVYAVTAHGELICCQTDGKELWRKHLKRDFKGTKGDSWGYSESVLVDGDVVVCTPGGPSTTIAALDKRTGEVKWTCVREGDAGAGHSSIVISEIGGIRIYVQSTASGAMGVRAEDGKLLWSYPIEKTTCVIPSPIIRGDLVFYYAGYNRGGCLLRQVEENGEVSVKEVYALKKELSNRHGGIVLIGDYLYGDSEASGIPFCAELETGKVKWKKRGSGKDSASIVAADGRLYVRYSNGQLALAKIEPDDYVEVGTFKIPGSGPRPSWSHPVIVDGRLYLREQNQIHCYDIRTDQAASAR